MSEQQFKISKIESMERAQTLDLSLHELSQRILKHNWSPFVFKYGRRKAENFLRTDIIVLDVDNAPEDEQMSLAGALELFKDHKHIIATTRSHRREKHSVVADRFRVILFLRDIIYDEVTYKNTWKSVYDRFSFIDERAKDAARLYFPSCSLVSIEKSGKLIDPVFNEKLNPKAKLLSPCPTKFTRVSMPGFATVFFQVGAPKGEWNDTLFRATCCAFECGWTLERVIESCGHITGWIESGDLTTICSAFYRVHGVKLRYAEALSVAQSLKARGIGFRQSP